MRTVMFATLATVAAALVNVAPASAGTWTCTGPAYVCGDAPSTSVTSSKPAKAHGKQASKSSEGYASKPKKAAKAVANDDDDAPVRKGKKVASSGGGGAFSGKASYYWQPQKLASGGWFNPNAMTAAHKTLPFGTKVRVTNQHNGQSVVVTINDRGPYIAGRVIDLSSAAAGAISMKGAGVVPVNVAVLGR